MEEARKKLRICMVLVVAAAIIVGLIYYFHDVRGKDYATEGTLVQRYEVQTIVAQLSRQKSKIFIMN